MSYYTEKKELLKFLSQYDLSFSKDGSKFFIYGLSLNIKKEVDQVKNFNEFKEYIKKQDLNSFKELLNKDRQVFEFLEFAKNKLDISLNPRKNYFILYSKDYDIKNNYSKRYTIFINQDQDYICQGHYLINLNDLSLTQKGAIFSWEHVDYQIKQGYCNETIKDLVNCINLFKLNKKLSSGLKEKEKTKINKI